MISRNRTQLASHEISVAHASPFETLVACLFVLIRSVEIPLLRVTAGSLDGAVNT